MTPMPRRLNSSSLSLTPPLRSTAAMAAMKIPRRMSSPLELRQRGGGRGERSKRKGKEWARDQHGRKGDREELLNVKDRIEAMRDGVNGGESTGGALLAVVVSGGGWYEVAVPIWEVSGGYNEYVLYPCHARRRPMLYWTIC